MAAYAALVSLMNLIDDLHRHPRPPISLPREEVASLTARVAFLQEFLEGYNPHLTYTTEADPLEMRIADAAYAAEDAIETQIVDTINKEGKSDAWFGDLQKAIQEMALIEEAATEVKETTQQQRKSTSTPLPSSSSIPQKKTTMVGADGALLEMKDKLTSHSRDLQVIPIVGMGGSGKTTLALNIFQDRLIKEHFDMCACATVSQEFDTRRILVDVLSQLNKEFNQDLSEEELGEMLYKHLYGRRYLVIMDDMWSIAAWDGVRRFFPSNDNGSRIVVTTRLSNLAFVLSNSNFLEMSLLDETHSWYLLTKTVFGEKGHCPLELEDIGRNIGKGCKGLPLSIVVVGGFLAKSEQTREFWECIEGNLNSIVNLGDGGRCLKILYMSYKQLPVYLKPCFLYMGVFPEDEVIRVSELIRLWVVEGFLKAVRGKSLEEVAIACLESLIDRNLVMIDEKGSTGNIKYIKMHDLLRDLCLSEAEKQRFYSAVTTPATRQGIAANAAQRRIVILNTMSENEAMEVVSSSPHARSLILYHREYLILPPLGSSSRMLRVLQASRPFGEEGNEGYGESLDSVDQLVNARMLVLWFLPSRYNILWNLKTLCVDDGTMEITAPTDIWHMPHIRHLRFHHGLHLPDPPSSQDDNVVWENLHTLKTIYNFRCSKRLVKIIRNIKKLAIIIKEESLDGDRYCLTNLDCLDKLESLFCTFCVQMSPSGPDSLPSLISFPHSLKKLILYIKESLCSEEILEKIGLLPHLEKLRLLGVDFKESEWITTQGRFPSLKYLHLGDCTGLKVWTTESSHFPCLEHLYLYCIFEEMEIPLEFAEISTLKLIELDYCEASLISSAKRILEEQEELYGEEETTLQVQVLLPKKNKEHIRRTLVQRNTKGPAPSRSWVRFPAGGINAVVCATAQGSASAHPCASAGRDATALCLPLAPLRRGRGSMRRGSSPRFPQSMLRRLLRSGDRGVVSEAPLGVPGTVPTD